MTETYWHGHVKSRDDFNQPIKNEFIDGRTHYGPWAIMTRASWRLHGIGLGLGKGQRYVKQADGRFLKVAG
jgi:hypothetical protein